MSTGDDDVFTWGSPTQADVVGENPRKWIAGDDTGEVSIETEAWNRRAQLEIHYRGRWFTVISSSGGNQLDRHADVFDFARRIEVIAFETGIRYPGARPEDDLEREFSEPDARAAYRLAMKEHDDMRSLDIIYNNLV